MGILIALALVCAIVFAVTVIANTIVAVIGGPQPESALPRRLAQAGQAKLAVAGLDREYRALLRS